MHDDHDHHPACPCGCGELADECSGPSPSPLGSMTVTTPDPSPYRVGRVRRLNHHQDPPEVRAFLGVQSRLTTDPEDFL